MKCQSLFSGKNMKNIFTLSSAVFVQNVVQVNEHGDSKQSVDHVQTAKNTVYTV